MADSIPASRVLCLCTYRPGYAHPFGDRTYHTRIALPTLSDIDTVQVARAMLATDHLPETLKPDRPEGRGQPVLCRGGGQVPARDWRYSA